MEVIPDNAQIRGTRVRQEDSFAFSNFMDKKLVEKLGNVAVVADGMGGMSFGKEASQIAVHTFLNTYLLNNHSMNIRDRLIDSILHANHSVFELAIKENAENEVGTTLISAVILKNMMYWVSVGDSRIYLFRNNELIQLTEDHNYKRILYQQILDGKITKEVAEQNPKIKILTSYLGLSKLTDIDFNIKPFYLKEEDIILLCTDGLYDFLSEDEIKFILAKNGARSALPLINLCHSKNHEYQDNVTAVTLSYKPKLNIEASTTKRKKSVLTKSYKKIKLLVTSLIFIIFLGISLYIGLHSFKLFDWLPMNKDPKMENPLYLNPAEEGGNY